MKKLLLASTALVLSAGVAAADVALSGDGRMGLTYDNRAANKFAFTSRARVTFTLSGETDGGLAFGGSIRADNATVATTGSAGSVFISGDFGRLTMGDTDGAAQFVIGHVDQMSLINAGDLNEITYLGNSDPRPTARYNYTIDGFTVAASHSNPGNSRKTWSVAAGYSFDGFSVGLGYERQNAAPARAGVNPDLTTSPVTAPVLPLAARGQLNHIVFGASAELEGITGKLVVGRASGAGSTGFATRTQGALSVSGSFDEVTVTAFGRRDFSKNRYLGVGASYDLGGGASLRGGVVNTNFNGPAASRTIADFGVNFSF